MMSFRYMRLILFFDLPMQTPENRRAYQNFHKFLIKEGFIMMQYSVYVKFTLNKSIYQLLLTKIKGNKPKKGNIIAFAVTEKQFSDMEIIVGEFKTDVINSTSRTIIIQ